MLKQLDTLIGFAVVMLVVSLLITIITQMVSAFFGLRGKNLTDALRLLIFRIDPNITPGNAQALVKHCLTHCAISGSAMAMVTTVWDRVPVLRWLRQKWKTAAAIRPDEFYELLQKIKKGEMINSAPGSAPVPGNAALQDTATKIIEGLVKEVDPKTEEIITSVALGAKQLIGTEIAEAKALIAQYAGMTDAAFVNLEKRFYSVQDRARQWFMFHTRLITVAAATLAAFVLQLDAIGLLKRLSTDSDLRAKLAAISESVQQQADQVLDNTPREKLAAGEKLAASRAALKKLVATSGLELLPDPYPLQFSPGWTEGRWPHLFITNGEWSWPKRRLLGILISVALLSLGAPFWFNTLKSLTNLRPTLANAVEKKPIQPSSA